MTAESGRHVGGRGTGAVLMLALALALGMGGGAAAADGELDCTDWGNRDLNQHEMNMCARRDHQEADRALNAAYRALTGKIDARAKALLVEAQRAWIAFRDKECRYEASENEGGSIHPMIVSGCMARLTKQRARELKELSDSY
jgi:uncharacterized protein YecT (DUF1311 family)